MKLQVAPNRVAFSEGRPKVVFGNFDEVEITLRDGSVMTIDLNKAFWVAKLLEASDKGDWREVDRVIQNMRLNYKGPNHS